MIFLCGIYYKIYSARPTLRCGSVAIEVLAIKVRNIIQGEDYTSPRSAFISSLVHGTNILLGGKEFSNCQVNFIFYPLAHDRSTDLSTTFPTRIHLSREIQVKRSPIPTISLSLWSTRLHRSEYSLRPSLDVSSIANLSGQHPSFWLKDQSCCDHQVYKAPSLTALVNKFTT